MEPLRPRVVGFAPGLGEPRASGRERGHTILAGLRLPISFLLALSTTIGLFWFLGLLISGRAHHDVVGTVARIDFTRLIRDSDIETVSRVKPEIKKIEPPPSPQNVSTNTKASVAQGLDQSSLAPAGVDFGGSGEGGLRSGGVQAVAMAGGSDRGPVPQVRLDPEYPPQAKDRGIEGWVLVQFTVTREGRTKDIVILDSQPKGIWDRATIRAVANWRYQPALKDGKPIEATVRVRPNFEMER
jgi:periplasmic protein TonB